MGKKSNKCNGPDRVNVNRDPASESPLRTETASADSGQPRIKIDPEFQTLLTPLSPKEQAQLKQSLLRDGCLEPLVVWKGHGILLDGHHRHELCVKNGVDFAIREIDLPDRAAAIAWIDEHQGGRRNHTRLGQSYVRGRRYNTQKKSHGGSQNRGKASGHSDHLKTEVILGAYFKVAPKTIRRDGKFAVAVDTVAANCGAEVRRCILSGDNQLTASAVERWSRLPAAEQQKVGKDLLEHGSIRISSSTSKARRRLLHDDSEKLAWHIAENWSDSQCAAFLRQVRLIRRRKAKGTLN